MSQSLAALRALSRQRYLACLFLPEEAREYCAALHGFDVEMATLARRVSEPAPGEIRIQWWREVFEGQREHGGNPLAATLGEVVQKFDLPSEMFANYLETRIFDLYCDPMPDKTALEAYCGQTSSQILQSVAIVNGAKRGGELADAAGHAGVAFGVAQIASNTARHRLAKRCYIPAELLTATGLDSDTWLADPFDERHVNATQAMVALARDHYSRAVKAIAKLEANSQAAFLPVAFVPPILNKVTRLGRDIASTVPELGAMRQQFAIWRAATLGLPSL